MCQWVSFMVVKIQFNIFTEGFNEIAYRFSTTQDSFNNTRFFIDCIHCSRQIATQGCMHKDEKRGWKALCAWGAQLGSLAYICMRQQSLSFEMCMNNNAFLEISITRKPRNTSEYAMIDDDSFHMAQSWRQIKLMSDGIGQVKKLELNQWDNFPQIKGIIYLMTLKWFHSEGTWTQYHPPFFHKPSVASRAVIDEKISYQNWELKSHWSST